MSERKPQLKELALALNSLTWSEVKSMAVQLGMEYFRLQQIEQQNSTMTDRLLSAMDMWLNSDANATWAKIIKALNDTDKKVLAKEIEQKYCQPLDTAHATTALLAESAADLPPLCSNAPPTFPPPIVENLLSPISLAASDYSLPSPPYLHTSDSTEVSIPHAPSSPSYISQQAPSQPSTDPPISPVSEYFHTISPPSVSVTNLDGGTPISVFELSLSQPPSSPTLQPRKRKRSNSSTFPISPSPSPSPQPPPQPSQLSTTQPQELPGWHPTVVRETKQEKIRRISEEASELDTQFVAVVGQAEFCFSVRESAYKAFLPKFRITLKNLPISKKFKHLKFLNDKCDEIESASSVSKIFRLLRQYWNYTDFSLLHHLIKVFGDEDTKEMMERYISTLEIFERRTTIQDYEDATGKRKEVPQGFFETAFEVQGTKDPSEYTLYEVRRIVQFLAQQSSLEPYVPMIKKARIGSLVITIALPRPALDLLQQALYKEFLDTLNIVSVRINETTQMKLFCHKCQKVIVMSLNCGTVACITFVTTNIHLTLNLLSYRTDSLL